MILSLLRIAAVVVLPLVCIVFAGHLGSGGAALLEGRELAALCTLQELDRGPDAETECRARDWLWLFDRYAWLALAFALLPVIVFFGAAVICGTSRRLNAAVFPRLIPAAIGFVVANLLVQGGLLLVAMMAFYVAYFGNPPIAALVAAGVGIVGAAGAVVAGATGVRVTPALRARALKLTRGEAPALHDSLGGLASAVGAPPPDAVIVGLESDLWMAAGVVELTGEGLAGRCRGRVLHLPYPLMRVLDAGDFAALAAHELAHFSGAEAAYAARFLPLWTTIDRKRYDLDDEEDRLKVRPPLVILLVSLSRLPAKALLALLGTAFRGNALRIARLRERDADAAAAEFAGREVAAAAILKAPMMARIWEDVRADHSGRIALGKPLAQDLARHFEDLARLLVTEETAAGLREHALRSRMRHPYDIHDTAAARLKTLGVRPGKLPPADLRPAPNVAAGEGEVPSAADILLPDELQNDIEAALVGAEHRALRERGAVPDLPIRRRRAARIDTLYDAVYSVLGALVRIAPDPAHRFGAACKAGHAEMTEFDRMIFAEYARARRPGVGIDEAADRIEEAAGADGMLLLLEMVEEVMESGGPEGRDDARVLAWLRGRLGSTATAAQ